MWEHALSFCVYEADYMDCAHLINFQRSQLAWLCTQNTVGKAWLSLALELNESIGFKYMASYMCSYIGSSQLSSIGS